MEHAEIELWRGCQRPHTGEEGLPARAIIRPLGTNFVDGRVMNGRFAVGVVREGQALPLHPRIEHPQDEVKDAVVAPLALWAPLGQREVWEDKCLALWLGELDRKRRRCRLC